MHRKYHLLILAILARPQYFKKSMPEKIGWHYNDKGNSSAYFIDLDPFMNSIYNNIRNDNSLVEMRASRMVTASKNEEIRG